MPRFTALHGQESELTSRFTELEHKLDKKADIESVVELGNSLNKAEPTAAATEALHQDLVSKVDDIKNKLDSPLSSLVQGCIEGAVKSH